MAAGDLTQKWAASQALTITLASLTSSATDGQESAAVDLSAATVLDVIVQAKIKSGASAPANDKAVYLYVAGSEDGTKFPNPATGANGAVSNIVDSAGNCWVRYAQTIPLPASTTQYYGSPFSLAGLFGGVLPRKFSVLVRNYSGSALDSTAGNLAITYSLVYSNAAQS
jgi:hypothetical protein